MIATLVCGGAILAEVVVVVLLRFCWVRVVVMPRDGRIAEAEEKKGIRRK